MTQQRRLEALALLSADDALPGLELTGATMATMRPGAKPGVLLGHLMRAGQALGVLQ